MLTKLQKSLDFSQIKNSLKRYTLSPLGEERVENLEKLEFQALSQELELLSEFVRETGFRTFPAEPFPDIRSWVLWSAKKDSMLDVPAFLEIRRYLEVQEKIRTFFLDSASEILKNKGESIPQAVFLLERFQEVMDSEGNIKDQASPGLREIREKMRVVRIEIESKLKSLLFHSSTSHFFQEQIITVKDQRWVVPLKADFKGKVKGLVIDVSNTGETLFLEPQNIVEENNRFMELKGEERAEIIRILKNLTQSVRNRMEELELGMTEIQAAEFLYARACYGFQIKGTFPVMNDRGWFLLKKARHPLLANPVPIDIELGDSFRMLVITGPNTGGKTAALKTLGLLSFMACCGMMIPAEEDSQIGYFDSIFTDIGDEQSITQNLSTFSGHIANIRKILETVTERSLVLIDELGAGTDPKDGSALAAAILENLLERECRVVVTSHLETIKSMAFYRQGIQNASVEFDLNALTPRYRLLTGITGKSYALEIARRLGLEEKIVNRASELLQKESRDYALEEVVEKLNQEIREAKREKQRYSGMQENLNRKWEELYQRERELKQVEDAVKRKETGFLLEEIKATRKKLIQLIEDAKNYQDLEKLREKARELETLSGKAKRFTENKIETFKPEAKVPFIPAEDQDFSPGDRVWLKNMEQEATVFSVQSGKEMLTVMLGEIKMKTPMKDALKIRQDKAKEASIEVKINVRASTAPFQLNLLGKRRDEALREAERYVHQVSLSGMSEGTIVHGRGTGILKEGILEFLKTCSLVQEFKTALDGGSTHFKLKA